jgi:hypothetical protein
LSRCGRGRRSYSVLGQASIFRTKEAGASVRALQPSRRTTPPSIHKYIRTTDKSSLFRNKPGRPAGSPQPGRGRQRGWEGGRRGPRGSGVTLQIPTKDNET